MLQKIGSNLLLLLFITTSIGTSGVASYKILKNLPQARANQPEPTVAVTATPTPHVEVVTNTRASAHVENTQRVPSPTNRPVTPVKTSPSSLTATASTKINVAAPTVVPPSVSRLTPISKEHEDEDSETEDSKRLYEREDKKEDADEKEERIAEVHPTEKPEPTEVPEHESEN